MSLNEWFKNTLIQFYKIILVLLEYKSMLQSYTLQIHFFFQISLSTSLSQNTRCALSIQTKKKSQYHKISINISWL